MYVCDAEGMCLSECVTLRVYVYVCVILRVCVYVCV